LKKEEILILGDSWSQAYGVKDNESYAWKLQEFFPEAFIKNFGTGGHGVLQSWMMLERFYELTRTKLPRLVIFGFTPFMNARNTPSIARVESLRTVGNDVYLPTFRTLRLTVAISSQSLTPLQPGPLNDNSPVKLNP